MGKKNKNKSKKSSKSKKDDGKRKKSTVPKIDPEMLKNLNLKDFFRFWNGDVYVGEFTLSKEGNIMRHGKGKYFTADGHVLSGQWQDDVLVDSERISYPEGHWYRGLLENGRYSGTATYNLSHLGSLECSFLQGRPEGLVTLNDLDGFKWQGHVISSSVPLFPRNHFFDSEDAISKTLRQNKSHYSQSNEKSGKSSFITES